MGNKLKVVRTDQELECPFLDQALRDMGVDLVLLPDGIDGNELARQTRDADLILMCYTPITAPVIKNAVKLRGIVKYGVGIDAIDIEAAKAHKIPVVNIPEYAEETAFRNSTLQGAYFMIAARAIGLDVGPMSGFSNKIVDEEFFMDTTVKSNFLCNIGRADERALFQRLPRFEFEQVCSFA